MVAVIRRLIVLAGLGAVSVVFAAAVAHAQPGCLDQIGAEQRERLQQQRVTLNLREASIPTTLRLLAQQYRVNMVVTDDVVGAITLDFFQVPARDVFQTIIEVGRLDCAVTGGVLRVSTSKRLKAEQDERFKVDAEKKGRELALQKATTEEQRARYEAEARRREDEDKRAELEARGPVREETIRLRYADAQEVATTIQGILGLTRGSGAGGFTTPVALPQLSQLYTPSPPLNIPSEPTPPQTVPVPAPIPSSEAVAKGLTVGYYKATNSVFIRYYAKDLERIKKLIEESLDVPVPQIQIAAQMVITSLTALEQIGVQWGGGKATAVGNGNVVVGQGFATSPNAGGNPGAGGASNPGSQTVNPITTVPPPGAAGTIVSPATVGNLVNLSTLFLPTLANPAGGLLLGLIGQNFNISLAIQALEVQGKARTLAQPKAVTVENVTATIKRGLKVPVVSTPTQGVSQVQYVEANLRLEVTPRLIREAGENRIRMKIAFDNDNPDFSQSVAGNPSIFTRHQDTEVVVREGQRLVIGGVTNEISTNTVRQVPLLGRIPVLGWLFKSREIASTGEELIVILTPSVVSEPGVPSKR
jgi:type IV pilus assembly protein PilQ